jgi:hypothetical protein
MRHALFTAAAAALLLSGASCQSLPRSPVAAPMSEREAAQLADLYLDDQAAPARTITSIEPHGYGYFVSHKTDFDAAEEPPREWQVVDVRHTGKLRRVEFRKKQ